MKPLRHQRQLGYLLLVDVAALEASHVYQQFLCSLKVYQFDARECKPVTTSSPGGFAAGLTCLGGNAACPRRTSHTTSLCRNIRGRSRRGPLTIPTRKWQSVHIDWIVKLPPELPANRVTDHRIDLIPDSKQPAHRLYRMSPEEDKELKAQLDQYLADGYIEPARSAYGDGTLYARKKDGGLRICIDYRA